MIDVTEEKPSAATKFELYLRAAELIGLTVRMDMQFVGSSKPHDSFTGRLQSVALNGESDFGDEDEDERSIWLHFQGEEDTIGMTTEDSLYRLESTGWTLVNQGTFRREEDDDY